MSNELKPRLVVGKMIPHHESSKLGRHQVEELWTKINSLGTQNREKAVAGETQVRVKWKNG
jgi:hypothetical protein